MSGFSSGTVIVTSIIGSRIVGCAVLATSLSARDAAAILKAVSDEWKHRGMNHRKV